MKVLMKVNEAATAVDITDYVTAFSTSIAGEEDRFIGNTPSLMIDMTLNNISGDLDGCAGNIFLIDLNQGESTSTPVQRFIVQDAPEKYTKILKLTLYDRMILFNAAYKSTYLYKAGSFPTIQQQLAEIECLSGVLIDTSGLPAAVLQKTALWIDTTIIMRNYLGWIAELGGTNVLISPDDRVVFRQPLSANHTAEISSNFEKSDLISITRVAFDDGINLIEAGSNTGKTVFISPNNSYVDDQAIIDTVYSILNGKAFHALENMKTWGIDGIYPFDLIEYDGIDCIYTSIKRTYAGTGSGMVLSGQISIKNKDSIITKIDDHVRIKRLQTIIDQQSGTLTVLSEEVDDQNERIADLTISVDTISQSVSSIDQTVAGAAKSFEYYYLNNDGTRPSANDPNWSSTATWIDGLHTWRKTVIVRNDGTKTVGFIEDITGSTGATGPQGETGDTGVGITNAVFQYILSTSDSAITVDELYPEGTLYPDDYVLPRQTITANWTYNKPFVPGYYLWSRLEVTYDDNTVKYTVPVLEGAYNDIYSSIVENKTDIIQNKEQIGLKADQTYVVEQVNQIEGQIEQERIDRNAEIVLSANSIRSEVYRKIYVRPIREYSVYLQNDGETPTTDSSGWSENAPTWIDGKHVWMMHVTEFSDGFESTYEYGNPVDITGNSGTSVSITEKRVKYQYSSSGTTVPSGTWSETVPEVPKGNYLWTWTYVHYSDGNETNAYSVSYVPNDGLPGAKGDKGDKGDTGAKGDTGDDGNGINSITYYYARTTTQTIPSAAEVTSTTIPELDATNKYLWQKEVITYTKTSPKTTVLLLAVFGDKGNQGEQGIQGNTGEEGNGIQNITYRYATSTTQTAPAEGSITSITIPEMSAENKYLWQKETINYTKTGVSPKVTVSLIAIYGDQGIQGETGNGIKSWKVEYKAGTSATTPPTGTYSESVPIVPAGNYLWTRITYTYDDDTTMTSYSVSYKAGQTQTVQNQYYLSASDTEVNSLAPLYPSDTLYPKDYRFPIVETSETNRWLYDQPDNIPGFYMWMRQKITMDDGTEIYTVPTLDKGYSELFVYHLEEKAGIEETNNNVRVYAEGLRTLQTDVATIKSEDIANINIDISSIRSDVASSYERVQEDFVSKQELGSTLEQTKSEVKAEIWETNEGQRVVKATANLDEDGLHVSTANDDTTLDATGGGILVMKDENGNQVVVVKFTKDDSLANYLEVMNYLTFGAHRWERRTGQEWNGVETVGSAALWKGAV